VGRKHQTPGSQLRLPQADSQYSPGCTLYSKIWCRWDGVVGLFVDSKVVSFIVLLLRLRSVGFRMVSTVSGVSIGLVGLGLGLV